MELAARTSGRSSSTSPVPQAGGWFGFSSPTSADGNRDAAEEQGTSGWFGSSSPVPADEKRDTAKEQGAEADEFDEAEDKDRDVIASAPSMPESDEAASDPVSYRVEIDANNRPIGEFIVA